MSRNIALNCRHCTGRAKIIRSRPDCLHQGDALVVVCADCEAVDEVKVDYIETKSPPRYELIKFKAKQNIKPASSRNIGLACPHCKSKARVIKSEPEILTDGEVKLIFAPTVKL